MSHIDPSIPFVGVCNISEPFYDFLSRAKDDAARLKLVHGEQYRADRVLVWSGDNKLVYGSFPIPHAADLYERYGYQQTRYLAPKKPSAWLSYDILREPDLLQALIDYAGSARAVQLVPYATTPQFLELVETLRRDHDLTILLPETPTPEAIWVRDYIDTKVGYRTLVSRWLPDAADLLPQGFVCHDTRMAAQIAHWYLQQDRPCIIKADDGENGIGNITMQPGDFDSVAALENHLCCNAFLGERWLTVETLITARRLLSPSLECYVPPSGQGEPRITYLSDQIFQEFGDFCGVLVSRELMETRWYPPFAEAGLTIARNLQRLGYIGHFDLDAVVDDDEKIYLLEVNSRRTGGTHVHEFAHYYFGENYLDQVTLLSNDTMKSGSIEDYETLRAVIGDLEYPINGDQCGVIIMITSALVDHEYGCIIVGSSKADAMQLQQQLNERVQNFQPARP